ncbi:MAG: hypothetical protein DMF78_12580 [Acidobacteria bacterium]|nr:MAG: hypothetical protein DMF78_12580 [Acidobacteriota bacterium]
MTIRPTGIERSTSSLNRRRWGTSSPASAGAGGCGSPAAAFPSPDIRGEWRPRCFQASDGPPTHRYTLYFLLTISKLALDGRAVSALPRNR